MAEQDTHPTPPPHPPSVTAGTLVGDARRAALLALLDDWACVARGEGPRMVYLRAPLGWGKTRIVQEFYAHLAAQQEQPGYWPPQIVAQDADVGADDLIRERKRLLPPSFRVEASRMPPWVWLAVETDPSVLARPEDAYRRLVEQLEPHLYPILRRQRLSRSARRAILSLITGLLPVPSDVEAVLELYGAARQVGEEWLRGRRTRVVIGDDGAEAYAARLWRLLTGVWGENGTNGPPVVVVVEDAQFISEQSADLVRAILGSRLPVLVVATGWPLAEGDNRQSPMSQLVAGRPARLRVQSLDALTIADVATLVAARHPGTRRETIETLAERCGGNPYAVRLMLVRLGARPGFPVEVTPGLLRRMRFDIHAQYEDLLWRQDARSRLALAAAAVLGYRMPRDVGDDGAKAADPPATLADALGTQWMRPDALHEDLVAFIEPLRHEVAQHVADGTFSDDVRLRVVAAGMAAVRRMLDDDVPDTDRDLLNELHLTFATAGVDRDEPALARSATELLRSLRRQRALPALRALLGRLDALVNEEAVPTEVTVELTLQRIRALRVLYSRSNAELVSAVQRALDLSATIVEDRPDLRIRALLAKSRMHRFPDNSRVRDIHAARSMFEEAAALAARTPDLPGFVVNSLKGCEYALVSAEHDRGRAYRLALAESERRRSVENAPTGPSLEALADAAWYATRMEGGERTAVEITRRLLEERRAYWGTDRHPRIARGKGSLAIRLLRTGDDNVVEEAYHLASEGHRLVEDAYGPDDPATVVALSARSHAIRRLAQSLWFRGERTQAARLAAQAASDSAVVLESRQRRLPEDDLLVSRERYGAALAWTGDTAGLDVLRECLRVRIEERGQPTTLAEVRWLAADLRDALVRHGRDDEAANIAVRFGLGRAEVDSAD